MGKLRFLAVLLLVVIMAMISCQKQRSPQPQNMSQTIPPDAKLVCLFFDDCWQNQYDVALPILLQCGFKATFGVITGYMGTGTGAFKYVDKKGIEELATYGMDIACHSKNHPHLITDLTAEQLIEQASETYEYQDKTREALTDGQLRVEIIDSKYYLEGLGFQVRTFIYPYFEYDDKVIEYVKEAGYVCARAGSCGKVPFDLKTDDAMARYHVSSCAITHQDLGQFRSILDKASRYFVVCLTYHHISDLSTVEECSTPIVNFAEQMRYLKENGFTVVLLPDLFE